MHKSTASKKFYCIKKKKIHSSQLRLAGCWVSKVRSKTKLSLRAGTSNSEHEATSPPEHVNQDILHH